MLCYNSQDIVTFYCNRQSKTGINSWDLMRQRCCLVTHQQLPLGPCWGRNVDGPPSFPATSSLQLHIQPTVPMRAPGLSVDSGQIAIALGGARWAGSCIQKLYCISPKPSVRIRIVRYYKFIIYIYKPVRTRMHLSPHMFVEWCHHSRQDEWCSNCKAHTLIRTTLRQAQQQRKTKSHGN